MPDLATLSQEWDRVRAAFATSIMVDTPLASLAQNLDGPEWPLQGADETPSAYIDFSFPEVTELLALKKQPPERAEQLIVILRDTLAFDDPFGEMVAQSEAASEKDNPILKNLAKLEIPPSHPIDVTALSPETLEFCRLEKLSTLGEFAVFAQGMAQTIVVGGDFRELLNALSHVDEQTLARLLPYRPGAKGVHLIEAVALIARKLSAEQAERVARGDAAGVESERLGRVLEVFADEFKVIKEDVARDGSPARAVSVLNDRALEERVSQLLAPHLPIPEPEKKRGWFGRLFGR